MVLVNMKWSTILLISIALLSFCSADIVSINYGGNENIIINSNPYIEGFFFGEDNIPPIITIISPTSTELQTSKDLNITIETNEITNCSYKINEGDNISIDTTGTTHSTIIYLGDGNYNITAYCEDSFGNLNSTYTQFSVSLSGTSSSHSSSSPSVSVEPTNESIPTPIENITTNQTIIDKTKDFVEEKKLENIELFGLEIRVWILIAGAIFLFLVILLIILVQLL